MPLRVVLSINSCDFLEDIYVTKNKYHSKDWMPRALISHFMPNSILFQATEHPNYHEKRKVLSAAFFKSKLISMTQIIKEVADKEVKRLKNENKEQLDLV